MTDEMKYVGRLVMYNEETHLEPLVDPATIKPGDLVQVIRGNGLREGESMGDATILKFSVDGELEVRFV